MKKEIYVCWFSCGITSAISCKIAIENYGIENCLIVYIGIKTSHTDNERFIENCEKWFNKKILTINGIFEDQFQVIEKIKFINSPFGASCTSKLKKDVRLNFTKKLQKKYSKVNQVFGFEYSKKEFNRALRFKEQNPETNPIFPLIERKIDKKTAFYILEKQGIKKPKMYELGFQNNNCIGCVKGGMGYWNKIKKEFPQTFEKMVEIENKINHSCIKNKFLKDLKDNEGNFENEILPDCGLFCEIEFSDLLKKETIQEFSK
jgi:hypothetical protein